MYLEEATIPPHMQGALHVVRIVLAGGYAAAMLLPAWWIAGRLQERKSLPFFRMLLACGLAIAAFLTSVNLLGRFTRSATLAFVATFLIGACASASLLVRRRGELDLRPLLASWRGWIVPVLFAVVLGFPQWLLAVSTNYWDEAACSAIHLTGPNQIAEGLYPPRHNALPDVPIKYHYGVVVLAGALRWLTGLTANVTIDLVSTSLWLLIFLFIYFWLRELDLPPVAATWGSFTVPMGGGLHWLYLRRIEVYDGLSKSPPLSELVYRYDATKSWLANLVRMQQVPSLHLRNIDGSLSNLPWDTAALFEQHPVALGIALCLVALYLFTLWQGRRGIHLPLAAANVLVFAVLVLAHAVFGGVGAITACVYLLGAWLRERTLARFLRGVIFGPALAVLALLHGGMLSRGAQYGAGGFSTMRTVLGYAAGGLRGFLDWNIASYGLLIPLALLAWGLHHRARREASTESRSLFWALTIFTVFSYTVPQLMYYSSEGAGVEQYTEISKFFFSAHLGLALLSALGVGRLLRAAGHRVPGAIAWSLAVPALGVVAVAPVAFCYAASFDEDHHWRGFYRSPYLRGSVEEQMGTALGRLKHGPRDVYFDASADERVHGYLSEMLIFGGSVFTMTPSRFERTGIGFRLAEKVVADRYVQNGRLARLLPGAAEEAGCSWYYARPAEDLVFMPPVVRARFARAVAEGFFDPKLTNGKRALYEIVKSTASLDEGIERYWRPRIVSQVQGTDWDGDGTSDLLFYDLRDRKIVLTGAPDAPGSGAVRASVSLPEGPADFLGLYVGKFAGDPKVDFLMGHMKDTVYRRGVKIEDLQEYDPWGWIYRDSGNGLWQPEYEHWYWDLDVPFVADLDNDGCDSRLAYRENTGEWLLADDETLPGPKADRATQPLPFGGRFLEGTRGDLGLWSLQSGTVTLMSLTTGQTVSFQWGGREGDVLVPGDYDGDGYYEIGVWQQTNRTWYWRRPPEGPISRATFGTQTCVPLPADYDHDGKLDLAYWEPSEGKIYVSFDRGRTIGLTLTVPPHSIPAFVNML